ncbi:TrmB family transcriptional regulator [bacterium]|nr:TrmB family transcriptional regulator [candidate division CSSED10-310 bacterium]
MNIPELHQKLQALGLSDREVPVYTVLLQVKQARASEIADITGIHRPTVYALLKDLIERGLVISGKGKVKYFRAAPPDAGFRPDFERRRRELTRNEMIIGELDELYRSREEPPSVSEGIEILTLRQAPLVLDWIKQAKRRVLSIHHSPTPRHKTLQERIVIIDDYQMEQMKKGVEFRCIYSKRVIDDPNERMRMDRLTACGERARRYDDPPMILMIIDYEKAAFTLYRDGGQYTTYLVTDAALITMLEHSFERLWELSDPLP